MKTYYLDANAGVTVSDTAWQAYVAAATQPSHSIADAHARLNGLRERIAAHLQVAPEHIVFTSGGTHANALAAACVVQYAKRHHAHVVTSPVEHPSVFENLQVECAAYDTALVQAVVDADGVVAPPVQVQHGFGAALTVVCSETGVVQPVGAWAAVCAAHDGLLHLDGTQALGKLAHFMPGALRFDLMTLSGHKIGAPAGIGLLIDRTGRTGRVGDIARDASGVAALASLNIPGAAAFEAALAEVFARGGAEHAARCALRDDFEATVRAALPQCVVIGERATRIANTICLRIPGIEADGLLMALDIAGVAVSVGTACSSGAIEPSATLLAMGMSRSEALEALRVSLPSDMTREQVQGAADLFVATAKRLCPILEKP